MANLKTNKREQTILQKYSKMGYSYLTKGYPDFLFFKETDNKIEAVFVEVKRIQKKTKKMGLSSHQQTMIDILKRLGLNVLIERV